MVLGQWHSSSTLAVVLETEEKPFVSIILGQRLANETPILFYIFQTFWTYAETLPLLGDALIMQKFLSHLQCSMKNGQSGWGLSGLHVEEKKESR